MKEEGRPGSEGKVVLAFGIVIAIAPALFGPIMVAVQCGENAQFNCSAYYWPFLFIFTIPIGLIFGIIGLTMYFRDKKK